MAGKKQDSVCPNCFSDELHADFPDETVCAKCNMAYLPEEAPPEAPPDLGPGNEVDEEASQRFTDDGA